MKFFARGNPGVIAVSMDRQEGNDVTTQRRHLWFAGARHAARGPSMTAARLSGLRPPGAGRLLQFVYSGLLYLALPLLLLHLLLGARRHPGYLHRVSERFGITAVAPGAPGCIWIHAVSVGEVQAALPLVKMLKKASAGRSVLVTTTTPTGSDAVRRLLGDSVRHCYLPWDLPGCTARFLDHQQPAAALIVETELWPNLFSACERRGIPLLLINARLSSRSARHYKRLLPLMRRTLCQSRRILARSPEDARRFLALGASVERVRVTGNMKFDYSVPASLVEAGQALRRSVTGRNVWVAASTHAGEESIVLDVHRQLRRRFPGLLLVLVPRHPERFGSVAELCAARGLPVVNRSSGHYVRPETAVMLGDTMGELPLFYAMADMAFIGGSLVPVGGHNPVEAAAHGVPLVIGPQTFKIPDTLELFLTADAMTQVADGAGLTRALTRLLECADVRHRQGENARRLVVASRGATLAVLAELRAQIGWPEPGSMAVNQGIPSTSR
ncbi:MAG: lipid IV(A) 3-deoxy-D-manno-octulosonic acid transferase [Aquisalimonadaceae bacterium]